MCKSAVSEQLPRGGKAFLRVKQRSIFQSAGAVISGFVRRGKYVCVIIFAVLKLVPSRMAGGVQMSNAVKVSGNIGNYVSFGNLLMIDIKHYFHIRAPDFSHNIKRLGGGSKIVAGMIDLRVERFNHNRHARALEYIGAGSETFNNGLMLIDQHRASQRILFEQYMKNMRDHSAHTQKVLFPEVVQFPPSYAAALDDILSELSILGFELNNLGNNSYAVEGIPSGLGGMDAVRLVNDLVTEAVELGNSATNEINSILAASLAQRAATPYGEILSNESMESLVRQLFHCSSQRYTPDGKPIINVITNEEIERRFK